MERGQGRRISEEKITRIKQLLEKTEMTVPEIARRMGCTEGPILSINRRFGIRLYNGKKRTWQPGPMMQMTQNPT